MPAVLFWLIHWFCGQIALIEFLSSSIFYFEIQGTAREKSNAAPKKRFNEACIFLNKIDHIWLLSTSKQSPYLGHSSILVHCSGPEIVYILGSQNGTLGAQNARQISTAIVDICPLVFVYLDCTCIWVLVFLCLICVFVPMLLWRESKGVYWAYWLSARCRTAAQPVWSQVSVLSSANATLNIDFEYFNNFCFSFLGTSFCFGFRERHPDLKVHGKNKAQPQEIVLSLG